MREPGFCTCFWTCLLLVFSGGCDGGGQGAFVGGSSKESDLPGETTTGEPEPRRASTGASPGGEEYVVQDRSGSKSSF